MSREQKIKGIFKATENSDSFTGYGTIKDAVNAIEQSGEIPVDVKQAVKDFVHDKFEELKEMSPELMNFPIPDELVEYWPLIVEILQSVFGG